MTMYKRNIFLANQNSENFENACYALINYYKAAAIAEKAFVKLVDEGQKSLLRNLIGFGEPLTDHSERAEKNEKTLSTVADNLRIIHDIWTGNKDHPNESIEYLMDRLEVPSAYSELIEGNSSSDADKEIVRGASTVDGANAKGLIPEEIPVGNNTELAELESSVTPESKQTETPTLRPTGTSTPKPTESIVVSTVSDRDSGHETLTGKEKEGERKDTGSSGKNDTKKKKIIKEYSALARTTKPRVNVREAPDQSAQLVAVWEEMYKWLDVTGYAVDESGTTWYRVILPDKTIGFIRGDLIKFRSDNSKSIGIKNTIKKNTVIYKEPNSKSKKLETIKKANTSIEIYDRKYDGKGRLWHYVLYKGVYGYIQEDKLE